MLFGNDLSLQVMKFDRLKFLLIIAFLLVAVVPLSVLIYLVESSGENLIKEKVSSHLLGLSDKGAEAISGFLLERRNDLQMLAYTISIAGTASRDDLRQYLSMMIEHYRVYVYFFILDQKGGFSFSGLTREIPPASLSRHLPKIRIADEERASDVFLLHHRGREFPAILLSTPLYDRERRRTGTVFGLIDFSQMADTLKKTVIEQTGEVYLVNGDGFFLSSSRFGVKVLKDKIRISPRHRNSSDEGTYEQIDYRGKTVLHTYRRIAAFDWYVISEQDREEALSELYRFRKFMVFFAMTTLLLVFLLAYFIAALIVRKLKANYRREKELEFQVVQKDKVAALGLLSAGLAHELNTPLANALLYTQMLQEELDNNDQAQIRERLTTIEEVVKRGSSVVRNLLDFTRHTESGVKRTDVAEAVEKLLALVGPHCESKKIRIDKVLESGMPPVLAETGIVQEILTNLVSNAIDAMPQGGVLQLTARYLPVLGKIRVDVGDTGEGIPEDLLGKVFDPFLTTKKQGDGIGLGLFVSYEMARRLGGTIRVISSRGKKPGNIATLFTLELPIGGDGTAGG